MSSFPGAARLFVVLALAASPLVVPPGASSADRPRADRPRTDRPVLTAVSRTFSAPDSLRKKRVPKRATIVFEKNRRNPFNSRVHFRVWAKQAPKRWVALESTSWRAGSGLGGRAGKDSCHRNVGWLPNGSYSFVQRNRRDGPAIKGRVFELESKACRNGTVRQLLFIHSEQTRTNTQCRNRKGDDRCRWEVPTYNDYKSNGCIKMSPWDLRDLTRRYHRYFKADKRYAKGVVKVRVTD